MSGDSGLSEQQRAELAISLRAKRDELRRRDLGERAATPDDEADPLDVATGVRTDAELAGIAAHDTHLLVEVEHAIARLKDGTYGFSEETGEPIPFERLLAVPWARRTAREEELREKRAKR